jgi:hypothetical protein
VRTDSPGYSYVVFVSPRVVARVVIIGLYTCCYSCDEIMGEEFGKLPLLARPGRYSNGDHS